MALESSWSWLLRNVVVPAGDRIFQQEMIPRLNFLKRAQWWREDELIKHRDDSLRRLIRLVYEEVPFYRALMDEARVHPAEIGSPKDLAKLPVVSKDMLRSGYPEAIRRPTGLKTFEARTSGSTGRNFTVLSDARTEGRQRAAFMLALGWAGWRIGEAHLQTGITFNRSLDRRLKDALLRCHYVSAAALDDETLDRHLQLLDRKKIRHVWGYPGSLFVLAEYALAQGWNQSMKTIVTWGDNLYPHYRDTIQRAFGASVTDTYGCGEGIEIAAQCEHADQYHIHVLDTVVEFLDDEGQPVGPGDSGNLILTRLHPGPMPLIRYRIGDVGYRGTAALCPCGRQMPTMGGVQGRDTDFVTTPAGNRLVVHFFTGILAPHDEIDQYQVVQEDPGSIILRIVPRRLLSKEFVERLKDELRAGGADGLDIHVISVNEIPLTPGGKRRFVINRCHRRVPIEQRA